MKLDLLFITKVIEPFFLWDPSFILFLLEIVYSCTWPIFPQGYKITHILPAGFNTHGKKIYSWNVLLNWHSKELRQRLVVNKAIAFA